MFPERFFRLAVAASSKPIEVTLRKLFEELELVASVGVLDKLTSTKEAVDRAQLKLVPDLTSGDLETVRILTRVASGLSRESLLGQIASGENALTEFKSSFFFDWKRFQARPDTPAHQLNSEDVTYFALRALASFLNSSGGALFVGVSDSGEVVGIDKDFAFCQNCNIDGWQLKVRDLIKTRFHEGDLVNNYIQCDVAEHEGVSFVRLNATARSRLSFLKGKDRFQLFCRQGNRTIDIPIEQMEEYISGRTRLSQD